MKTLIPLLVFLLISAGGVSYGGTNISSETAYQEARACYLELKANEKERKVRDEWERCIGLFNEVAKMYLNQPRGADAAYSMGRLREEMFRYTKDKGDLKRAIEDYKAFARHFRRHKYADDALFNVGRISWEAFNDKRAALSALNAVLREYPRSDMAVNAREYVKVVETEGRRRPAYPVVPADSAMEAIKARAAKGGGPATLMGVEHWSTQTYAKAVIYFDRLPEFKKTILPPAEDGRGPRIVIDLENTEIHKAVKRRIEVGSPVLKRIRMAKFTPSVTRVVFDAKDLGDTSVLGFQDNIVVNIYGKKTEGKRPRVISTEEIKTIVIDPGHGGADPGAIGRKGTKEKDVVLSIAKFLGAELKKGGYKVYFTRTSDKFVSLDARNAIANAKNADLFISIHANSIKSKRIGGLQTFYLNNATDEAARRLAERENKLSKREMSDLERIVSTLIQNESTVESEQLAKTIHRAILKGMAPKYDLVDRKVKSALFYVLVGAKCPAVLIETSFISNPKEEMRLKSKTYQRQMALSIARGIDEYVKLASKGI